MTRDAADTSGAYHKILTRDDGAESALDSTSIPLNIKNMNTESRAGGSYTQSCGIKAVTGSEHEPKLVARKIGQVRQKGNRDLEVGNRADNLVSYSR